MITENAPLCQTKNNKIPVIELQNWQKSLTDSKLTIKDLLKDLKDQYVIKKLSYRNLFQKIF